MSSYATEADIDFVRASVRAIGRCALKVDSMVDKCIAVLLTLLQSRISYVVQEAIIVIRDIFRKYPNKYTSVIVPMCAVMDLIDEPEAKASMVWVIGEYSSVIDNANELLDVFIDSFHDETPTVQLEMLTAVVKLFLKQPAVGQALVTNVLTMSTEESTNADVRDRGYMYWRLLSADAKLAKRVVLSEKPLIEPQLEETIDDDTLQELLEEIGLVSSVYHKTGESFITPHVGPAPIDETGEEGSVDLEEESEEYEESEEDDDIFDEGGEEEKEPNFIFYSCLLRNRAFYTQTMTRAAPASLEHVIIVLLVAGSGDGQQTTPTRKPHRQEQQRVRSGEERRVLRGFAHLREVVKDMARKDADQVVRDRGSDKQRERHEDEGHVESLHGDAPEGTGRRRVLLAPQIDAVLEERHAQQVAGIHHRHQLE